MQAAGGRHKRPIFACNFSKVAGSIRLHLRHIPPASAAHSAYIRATIRPQCAAQSRLDWRKNNHLAVVDIKTSTIWRQKRLADVNASAKKCQNKWRRDFSIARCRLFALENDITARECIKAADKYTYKGAQEMEIKVGGIHYSIEAKENVMKDTGSLGFCDYEGARIVVDASLAPERMQQVIIHELTHAIMYEAGFDEQDEDMVNRFGIVLHQVLCDNFTFGTPEELEAAFQEAVDAEKKTQKKVNIGFQP